MQRGRSVRCNTALSVEYSTEGSEGCHSVMSWVSLTECGVDRGAGGGADEGVDGNGVTAAARGIRAHQDQHRTAERTADEAHDRLPTRSAQGPRSPPRQVNLLMHKVACQNGNVE